jgi:hypothetical protein
MKEHKVAGFPGTKNFGARHKRIPRSARWCDGSSDGRDCYRDGHPGGIADRFQGLVIPWWGRLGILASRILEHPELIGTAGEGQAHCHIFTLRDVRGGVILLKIGGFVIGGILI